MQVGNTPRTVMMCGRTCRTATHRTPHIDMLLTIVICRGPSPHNHHGTGGRTRGRRHGHHAHGHYEGDCGTACAGLRPLAGLFPPVCRRVPPLGTGCACTRRGRGKPAQPANPQPTPDDSTPTLTPTLLPPVVPRCVPGVPARAGPTAICILLTLPMLHFSEHSYPFPAYAP